MVEWDAFPRSTALPDRAGRGLGGEVQMPCTAGCRASVAASLLAAHGRRVVAIDDDFDEHAAESELPLVAA